jgi:hypothetical protein
MGGRGRSSFLAALLLLAVAACSGGRQAKAGPYPDVCESYGFTPKRCAAVVVKGLEAAHLVQADVAAIRLLPPPEPKQISVGGGPIVVLDFRLGDGSDVRQEVACVGISFEFDPACGDDARIHIDTGINRDVPCSGQFAPGPSRPPGAPSPQLVPIGCATPPPTPPAALAAAAQGLRIDRKVLTIDHAGHYDVPLGTATLPNGYLSELNLGIADEQPTAYWIFSLGLKVTSDIPGRPEIGSLYREPYDGLEPLTVSIQFDVFRYVEPSTLVLENVVVR